MATQGLRNQISRMMGQALATGLFVSTCSAYAPTGNLGPSGAPLTTFDPVAGLQNIVCMKAPINYLRPTADEDKSRKDVFQTSYFHVLLGGYYPGFPPEQADAGWQVVIDGVTYDMLGAEHDSQYTQTRLKIRVGQV
jgi:hypothetical protein